MIYVASAVAIAALLLAAAILLLPQLRPAPSLKARTVVVNTRDERTIKGVLHGQHADAWILRDAVELHAGGEQPLGGLIQIPVENLSFAQVIE